MTKFKLTQEQTYKFIFLLIIIGVGIFIRGALFNVESGDMKNYLLPWFDIIKENGGFAALGGDIGNYTPAYYYIMAALSYFPINMMWGIKIVSCLFDLLTAIFVMRIVMLKYSGNESLFAFAAAFLLPSAVLNSAAWGQCDSIFTAFTVISLYYIMTNKDIPAMVFFGLAFAFKLQAVFFAPFLLLMLIKGKLRFRTLLIVPAVYVAAIIPALTAGGDFIKLLTVYFRQAGQYSALNLCLPNIWAVFRDLTIPALGYAGVGFAGALIIGAVYYLNDRKFPAENGRYLVTAAFFLTMLTPFLLPHMHERYYYLSDMLCVIFALYNKKSVWALFITQFCAVECVAQNIFHTEIADLRLMAVGEFLVLLAALRVCRHTAVKTDAAEQGG